MPGQVTEFLQTQFEDEIKKFIRNNTFPSDEEITYFTNYKILTNNFLDNYRQTRYKNSRRYTI
jgi:hypothetical protein